MDGARCFRSKIQSCKGCALYNNQEPLLDDKTSAEIMWVGLSAVKVPQNSNLGPLSENTNSGGLISQIEKVNSKFAYYKTNLVKCLPLENDKIRYPKAHEMRACYKNLNSEITEIKPALIFLLGKQVIDFVVGKNEATFNDNFKYNALKQGNSIFIPVHHPSYILVYKRKEINSYINGISKLIRKHN